LEAAFDALVKIDAQSEIEDPFDRRPDS